MYILIFYMPFVALKFMVSCQFFELALDNAWFGSHHVMQHFIFFRDYMYVTRVFYSTSCVNKNKLNTNLTYLTYLLLRFLRLQMSVCFQKVRLDQIISRFYVSFLNHSWLFQLKPKNVKLELHILFFIIRTGWQLGANIPRHFTHTLQQ